MVTYYCGLYLKKKEFKKWLFISIATFILYLSWLIGVLKQVAQVNESYWIQPITLVYIYGHIKFVLRPNKGIFMPLLGIAYIHFLVKLFLNKDKAIESKRYTLTGCLVLGLTVLWSHG